MTTFNVTNTAGLLAAMTSAIDGDTINMANGTYTLSSTLHVGHDIALTGASEAGVVLNYTPTTGYGILLDANGATLSNFTLHGAGGNAGDNYGIKAQPAGLAPTDRLFGITLQNLTVSNFGRSEVDLNGVDFSLIKNVTADGNGTAGNGIALTDSSNVTLTDITTTGNAWGSVALYETNHFYNNQTANITFTGTYTASESVKIYAQDESATTDLGAVTFPPSFAGGGPFTLTNDAFRSPATDSQTFKFFFANLSDAQAFAQSLPAPSHSHSVIRAAGGNFVVAPGMSIQAAIDAASPGDTIVVAAGTYNEHVNVNKDVTIQGANAGVDGHASRGAESSIVGGITVSAAGVTLNGIQINGSFDSHTSDGTDLPNGLVIKAAGVTVEDSVFTGDAADSRPFSTVATQTGLNINHNLFSGWNEGAYLVNGSTGTINHNTFVNDGNGILTESIGVDIAFNSFSGSVGADVGPLPFTDAGIGSFVHDNTFTAGHPRPISVFLNGPDGQSVTGSDVATNFHLEFHTGSATVHAGAGDDTVIDGPGNDHLSGGAGQDTAVFNVTFASAHVSITGGVVIIDSAEGHDDLTGFETFQFADGAFRLNSDHTALISVNTPQPPVNTPAPTPKANDFDGDGHSDILWQNADGTPAVWLLNGTSLVSGANVGFNPGPAWHTIGAGDFNGDGKSDILWQNNDGTVAEWFLNGTSLLSGGSVAFNPGAAWHTIGAGDFNGDGKSDILLQNTDGTPAVWLMNGLNILSGANVGSNPGAAWHAIGTGDFNGDGKADILWQNNNGQAAVWLMDGTSLISGANVGTSPGSSWHVQAAADFDGDGKADILWQNSNGQAAVWLMDGTNLRTGANVGPNVGASWQIHAAADFNGDGKADIEWQNSDGTPAVWLMDGLNLVAGSNVGFNPGAAWHVVPQHHDLV